MAYRRKYYSRNSADPLHLLGALAIILVGVGLGVQFWEQVLEWVMVLVVAGLIGGIAGVAFLDFRKWKREQTLGLAHIDQMTGEEFEHYVVGLLRSRGLQDVSVSVKRAGGTDFGIDVLGTFNGVTYAIQVKRYKVGNPVGVDAVREAHTGIPFYKCDRGMVITSGFFTRQAKELAKAAGIYMVDRNKLAEWIEEYQGMELGWREYVKARVGI